MNYSPEIEISPTFQEAEKALRNASSLPYNNASVAYEAAGVAVDPRVGGSCLFKLNTLREALPSGVTNVQCIMAMIGKTTHYAMTADIDGKPYYFDPFLWQRTPMPLFTSEKTEVDTLEVGWKLQREPDVDGALFVVSLVSKNGGLNPRYEFKPLDFLPSSAALPLHPELPSFAMQIPDTDGIHFFKIWYSKEKKHLEDIWVSNTATGERNKVTREGLNSDLRPEVLAQIEYLINMSEEELCEFFNRAHELEIQVKKLIQTSGSDVPHGSESD